MMKSMTPKRLAKDERERLVLLSLVDLYLETGKPIGSNTLREKKRLNNLSSATIRNYFSKLEKGGFLKQQHSSGGRIPTESAYKTYVDQTLKKVEIDEKQYATLQKALAKETREVATYLQSALEALSEAANCAVFISSPRFDQDYILDVKLIEIDALRCLCILVTDFGMIHTQTLYVKEGFSKINLGRVAKYLQWRISGLEKPTLSVKEELLGTQFYKEIMLRHIVAYSNFSAEDIYKTGFSKLLNYPDFNNAAALANGLSLFENDADLRMLLKRACEEKALCCLLGDDLNILSTKLSGCSVILVPYRIHQTIAGSIALLGPNRLPYKKLFGMLQMASELLSNTLTKSLYKFKISFRKPGPMQIELESRSLSFADQAKGLLIERKEDS